MKADEKKYLIESGNNYQEFIQNLDKIRRNVSDNQQQNQSALTITIKNDATIIVQENEMTVDYESRKAATNYLSLLNDSVSKKLPCIPNISTLTPYPYSYPYPPLPWLNVNSCHFSFLNNFSIFKRKYLIQ